MSDESRPAVPRRFVTSALPCLAGGGAFLVYLATLNKWLSLSNLEMVARTEGWVWQPELQHPLTWLLLIPFRWLPQAWIPGALNIAAAACAGLVLVLLARSVALLRHDLTPDDPLRKQLEPSILLTPTAWIPPVLAAVACGLQLSFWEHATSFTGEMINLLIFAHAIRCLLEFRIDGKQSWFSRCALVYGLGMANDWALVGYLPVLIAAMVWISGFQILYNQRWFLRTAAWGLAGLSLYLALPVLHSLSIGHDLNFWTALKANLKIQKDTLSLLRRPTFRMLAFTSLLPVIVLSIRWKSHTVQFNDDSRLGVFLTKWTVHFVHGLFFACAVWMTLDPTFSPRHLDLGMPMLTYYYTLSLVIGYCAGHFLLIGTGEVRRSLAQFAVATVCLSVLALPAALIGRNWSQIALTNGPGLREFARQLAQDLPAGKSVAVSDDARELFLLQAQLTASGRDKDVLPLATSMLPAVSYQKFMAHKFPSRWPMSVPTNKVSRVSPIRTLKLVAAFAKQEPVVCLHPGSGLYLEQFQERPNGLVQWLELANQRQSAESPGQDGAPQNAQAGGAEQPQQWTAANEQHWEGRWSSTLQKVATEASAHQKDRSIFLRRRLLLKRERNVTASWLAAEYARCLDDWGVQLQRQGQWEKAGKWFTRAIELNPENVSARINAQYNERRQGGNPSRLEAAALKREFQDLFITYASWREIFNLNGPVDEPTVQFEIGKSLLEAGYLRQATDAFRRCSELVPEWTEAHVWLALGYLDLRNFSAALQVAEKVEATHPPQDSNGLAKLLFCQTTALQSLGKTNEAQLRLNNFARKYQDRAEVLVVGVDLYSQNGQFESALVLLDELLRSDPTSVALLAKKGWLQLELSRYQDAISTLTAVVSRAPANQDARLNLAIARLGAKQFDAAQADYQELLKTAKQTRNALFGLAGIAWHKHETNTAVSLYQQFLSNSVPNTAQYALAARRLQMLTGE